MPMFKLRLIRTKKKTMRAPPKMQKVRKKKMRRRRDKFREVMMAPRLLKILLIASRRHQIVIRIKVREGTATRRKRIFRPQR